ncbi:MAG TPA: Hpt domain-containing protein [Lacipirellulaceae bacterium]
MNHVSLVSASILDVSGTLSRLGGDEDLFRDLIEFFVADAPELMVALRESAKVGDRAGVRVKAHALKGLVAGCGGIRAAGVAQQLETAGQSGVSTDLAPLIQSLQVELDALTQALLAVRDR